MNHQPFEARKGTFQRASTGNIFKATFHGKINFEYAQVV